MNQVIQFKPLAANIKSNNRLSANRELISLGPPPASIWILFSALSIILEVYLRLENNYAKN